MSKFDDEVNKILLEVNFGSIGNLASKGVGNVASGLAGLTNYVAPIVSPVAKLAGKAVGGLASGALKTAAGVTGLTTLAKDLAGVDLNKGIDKISSSVSEYLNRWINDTNSYDNYLKIDDTIIQSLNEVYGKIEDKSRYKNFVDLSFDIPNITNFALSVRGLTLKECKNVIINLMKDSGFLDEDFKKLIIRTDIDNKIKSNTLVIRQYNLEKKNWDKKLKDAIDSGIDEETFITTNPKPNQPKTDLLTILKAIFEKHANKSNYLEAIDHLLQFISDSKKSWLQRMNQPKTGKS
jgi:hypothetical protein